MMDLGLESPDEADAAAPLGPGGSCEPLPLAPAPTPGRRFGHYEIIARDDGAAWELGHGAMGVTYRAFDTVLRCAVALKVIHQKVAARPAARERFLREARAAAQLRHANVASVFHYGEQEGECFYAMELIEGETLEARVRRDGPLSAALALEVVEQVTRALVAAERCGLVHRDLKPENLMVVTGGAGEAGADDVVVKVIDFGLAKAAAAAAEADLTHGGFVGTPAFASPEQFDAGDSEGGKLDARSDIFSLGVTLWFLLTAKVPFAGRTLAEIHDRQMHRPLPLEHLTQAQVPASVVALLRTMLAADPAGRPPSARELSAALRRGRATLGNPAGSRRRAWRRQAAWALALLSALVALGVAGWFWWRPTAVAPLPVAVPEKSIAVLPFQPLVPEQRDQALELGMADTLIGKLSNSQTVVSSLTSVRRYDRPDQDPRAAGRELKVRSVLEGNVQRSGDRIRVSARLVNVADGHALWSGTFDERFTDVFTVQDVISQKVAEALALRLRGVEKERLTRRDTDNVAAYQLYLLGRYHWNKLIPPEIRASIGYFRQAIELDPHYALAHFGLADAYRSLAITSDVRPQDAIPQAKAAALKALELDGSLAEAHASLAFGYIWFDWDWAGAEREARRGVELNPNSGFAHLAYAHVFSDLGRHQEAIAEVARARELDPTSLIINSLEGAFLYHARRYDEARARLQKTLSELDPNFWIAHLFLGKTLLQQGDYPAAIAEFSRAREFSGGNSQTISMLGYAYALAGDVAKAQATLGELQAMSTQRYLPPCNVALVLYGLGRRDEAFVWLDQAVQEHDVHLSFLRADPQWEGLRGDPRFVVLLRRIGLR